MIKSYLHVLLQMNIDVFNMNNIYVIYCLIKSNIYYIQMYQSFSSFILPSCNLMDLDKGLL